MADGRTESIRIRVSPAEKGRFERHAREIGVSVSDLVRGRTLGMSDPAIKAEAKLPARVPRPARLDSQRGRVEVVAVQERDERLEKLTRELARTLPTPVARRVAKASIKAGLE